MPISFTCLIQYGADCLYSATPPLRHLPPRPPRIFIRTLNIRNVQGFGLEQMVQAVKLGRFDLIVLTKTKISTTAYFRN